MSARLWTLFCAIGVICWNIEQAQAFVYLHQLKPRLPVNPEAPRVVFYWSGQAPELTEKAQVLSGTLSEISDEDAMERLLQEAMEIWNTVPSSYVRLALVKDPSAVIDPDDEVFSIEVSEQDSLAVAASAFPNHYATDPNPSASETDRHRIHDCDITIGTSSVRAKVMLRTLVHEFGHCLGLGHPHASYHSIMSYAPLSDEASLSLDDKAGISSLYPLAGESEKVRELAQCGVLGASPASRQLSWLCFFAPVLLGWGRWLMRKRPDHVSQRYRRGYRRRLY